MTRVPMPEQTVTVTVSATLNLPAGWSVNDAGTRLVRPDGSMIAFWLTPEQILLPEEEASDYQDLSWSQLEAFGIICDYDLNRIELD